MSPRGRPRKNPPRPRPEARSVMVEDGVLFPQQMVVYFARNERVVKVGTTNDLVKRMRQLRAQEPGLKLAAWLAGGLDLEAYVYERFGTVEGREWLAPCDQLTELIAGIRALAGDHAAQYRWACEFLSKIETCDDASKRAGWFYPAKGTRLHGIVCENLDKKLASEIERVRRHFEERAA